MSYSERCLKVVVPVTLTLAGISAPASVFVLGSASRSLEATSQLVRTFGVPNPQVEDPDADSRTKLETGAWAPPQVDADSISEFGGITEAASGAVLVHTSDVSDLKLEGSTRIGVGALLNGYPGNSSAQAKETFSVSFSLTAPVTLRLSNDATINATVATPQVSGNAVLSLAGSPVLSLPLFQDGSVEAELQPGDYVFTASSLVSAQTGIFLPPSSGFDGSYHFALAPIPEMEEVGIGAAAALLGFGVWRRRATRA